MHNRLANLRAKFAQNKIQALLVSDPRNVNYLWGLTDFSDFDILLVVSAYGHRIITDSRYWEYVGQRGFQNELIRIKPDLQRPYAVAEAINQLEVEIVGVEASHFTLAALKEFNKAARKAKFKYKPTYGIVEELRRIKDARELDAIKRAVKLGDDAFAHFCANVRVGMTEREGAALIENFVRTGGGDGLAFNPIVASGPNSALPHAVPGDRKIESGEPLTLDLGAVVEGYRSDLTRTICLGKLSEKFVQVYNVVLKAQKTAEKKIRAGIRGKKADSYARRVIDKAGYGEYFGHGTGHGVGLAVHEGPRAGQTSKDMLEEGMTLTVEPGIYIPGWGGVRIEDLVVVRKEGVEILSQATKDPLVRV